MISATHGNLIEHHSVTVPWSLEENRRLRGLIRGITGRSAPPASCFAFGLCLISALAPVLLAGGCLPLDRLLALIDEPLESVITSLAMSDYSELVSEGLREWIDRGSAARLEKLSDDYITAYLKRGKWTPFGPEPLIGYLWAKEMEIKNIRLILVGKINKLPAEAIRERLRDGYL